MRMKKLLALYLVVTFLLSGCFYAGIFDMAGGSGISSAEDMVYTRPDPEEFRELVEDACETVEEADSFDEVAKVVLEVDSAYGEFVTNYHLSNIRYSADLTDTHWEEEYNFCSQSVPALDQAMERLYRTLARCPYREDLETDAYFGEDFFDDYDGELLYDDHFVGLTEKEASLENRYYDLCDQSESEDSNYGTDLAEEMAELLVELVALRQEIAAYAGYESFAHYTYDTYYGRDYTPKQAEEYLIALGQTMTPVLIDFYLMDDWGISFEHCDEQTALDYVRASADAMGGKISEAFEFMESHSLYDIAYSPNKYNASFEVFLPSYVVPFIFMNPSLSQGDKLTLAHEFGHFANDYACNGSYAGIDVAEVHSQAFEYMSLCYGPADQSLINYKLINSLLLNMQCSANALFELQLYQLTGEDLTVENVVDLYERITEQFGCDVWGMDGYAFVQTTHFYTSPMYMVSYVVSNDQALQIYQKELEKSGAGLKLYQKCLQSNESRIIHFAQEYGLESPFEKGRAQAMEEFYDKFFQKLSAYEPAA